MPKKLIIDNAFIEKWHPKYDEIEDDEDDYQDLIKKVQKEVSKLGTLSKNTLESIYNWKAARAKGYVEWQNFDKYEEGVRNALQSAEYQKIAILNNLPGIGIPVASTILHLIYPKTFPIVDFRTIEVLQNAGYLDQTRSINHFRDTTTGYYGFFRTAILNISQQYTRWSLRQIDRALFAYHKMKIESQNKCSGRKSKRCS